MSSKFSKELELLAAIRDMFNDLVSVEEFETKLSMLDRLPRGIKIWVQIVYISTDLDEYCKNKRYKNYRLKMLKDGGTVIHLIRTIGRKNIIKLDGFIAIIPTSHKNIYKIISISDSEFWSKGVARFIDRGYPQMVRIFYRQIELKNILLNYEKSLASRFELSATDITLKEKRIVRRKKQKRREEYDSERRWTDSSIKRVFDDAEDRNQWFKTIQLNIQHFSRNNVVAILRISKHGMIAFDHLYEVNQKFLFPTLEKIAFNKTELFSKRGLRERKYKPAKPVSIDYSMDVFHETKNVKILADVIKLYPNSSKSVYHGNPYLHISIADYLDGSSFEIWVLSPRRILLIPQARASVPSYEKLISYLFENFKEGELEEYSDG